MFIIDKQRCSSCWFSAGRHAAPTDLQFFEQKIRRRKTPTAGSRGSLCPVVQRYMGGCLESTHKGSGSSRDTPGKVSTGCLKDW